jgi:hypothetical protein
MPELDNLREYYRRMSEQLTRALVFLVALNVLLVVGVAVHAIWGNPFANWQWRRPAASTQFANPERSTDRVENGIHLATGLKVAPGFDLVRVNCTACHSAELVIQNRATREGWKEVIRWMQRTQGLWDLGEKEKLILDYLAAHYAPETSGRRPPLDQQAIEWYPLEEE